MNAKTMTLRKQSDEAAQDAAEAMPESKPLTVGQGNKSRPMRVLSRGQGGWWIGTRQTESDTHQFIKDAQFQGRAEMGYQVFVDPKTGQYDCMPPAAPKQE